MRISTNQQGVELHEAKPMPCVQRRKVTAVIFEVYQRDVVQRSSAACTLAADETFKGSFVSDHQGGPLQLSYFLIAEFAEDSGHGFA